MQQKEDLEKAIQVIQDTAESIIISNEAELQQATDFIKRIKKGQTVVKDFYKPMVTAAKESYDKIKKERDKLLKPLEDTEQDIRNLMNEYNTKVMMLKKAEEERLRKEQEEQKKKLEEAKQDMENGNTEIAQAKISEVMNSTTLPNRAIETPKVQGMGVRIKYSVEVTDIEKVPAKLNDVPLLELSKLGQNYLIEQYKIMKALGKDFDVPGIKINEEATTIIR